MHLGRDRIDILGHSAGATLALLYGAAHPHRIGRLALMTPSLRRSGAPHRTATASTGPIDGRGRLGTARRELRSQPGRPGTTRRSCSWRRLLAPSDAGTDRRSCTLRAKPRRFPISMPRCWSGSADRTSSPRWTQGRSWRSRSRRRGSRTPAIRSLPLGRRPWRLGYDALEIPRS
ncbi:MAG TPA: alpha/beta fold hydrolase [Candidatus Dormibacteraeota bacterium]|nr:alpha/beta fold hydrolase [Candidatus Dormibacteraeota bacterium]